MLVKIFKQLVVTICLVSILFSSPAIALASQNIEAPAPKENLNITDKTYKGNISNIIGTNTIIDDTNFFKIQNFQHELITELIPISIGRIVGGIGGIVGYAMAISVGIPIAGVADAVLVGQEINHALTSYKEENDISIKLLSSEKLKHFNFYFYGLKSLDVY